MYTVQKNTFMNQEQTIISRQNEDGSVTSFGLFLDNTDYRAYLVWLEQGNMPEEVNA